MLDLFAKIRVSVIVEVFRVERVRWSGHHCIGELGNGCEKKKDQYTGRGMYLNLSYCWQTHACCRWCLVSLVFWKETNEPMKSAVGSDERHFLCEGRYRTKYVHVGGGASLIVAAGSVLEMYLSLPRA